MAREENPSGNCNVGEINSVGEINPVDCVVEIKSYGDYLVKIALRRLLRRNL